MIGSLGRLTRAEIGDTTTRLMLEEILTDEETTPTCRRQFSKRQ